MLKVEKPLRKRVFEDVEAIRIYLPELMQQIDQTRESGEKPRLLVKTTVRRRTGRDEVEIVFLGRPEERHLEEIKYFSKDPRGWQSWGIIVLSRKAARRLGAMLLELTAERPG